MPWLLESDAPSETKSCSTKQWRKSINPFSHLIYQGKASIQAENARTEYNTKAAQLDPSDKAGRAQLKVEGRNNTPEPFKSIIEKGRPIAAEKAKVTDANFKGNATKTNAEINDIAKTTGTLGRVFIGAAAAQSTYTIVTSDNPVRETATEAAGWVGASYVGGQFATAGVSVGGHGVVLQEELLVVPGATILNKAGGSIANPVNYIKSPGASVKIKLG